MRHAVTLVLLLAALASYAVGAPLSRVIVLLSLGILMQSVAWFGLVSRKRRHTMP